MTVGIVVVSHSAALADGAAELARSMAPAELRLLTAAGTGYPEHPLGTDTHAVLEALTEADDGDGVLVLADLGGAVLAAELAIELLEPQRRARVVLSSAPLVEGLLAAAVSAGAGSPLAIVAEQALTGLSAKQQHLDAPAEAPQSPDELAALDGRPSSAADCAGQARIVNPDGIHARPAAGIVGAVSRFDAEVFIGNANADGVPVRADSLNSLLLLGARLGHEVRIEAYGPQAAPAVAAVQQLIAGGFGELVPAGATANRGTEAGSAGPAASPSVITGLAASPGLAVGRVSRVSGGDWQAEQDQPDEPAADVEHQLRRLAEAVEETRRQLRQALAVAMSSTVSGIVESQLVMLSDPVLVEAAAQVIRRRRLTAESAWRDTVRSLLGRYRLLADRHLAERGADLQALAQEVLRRLRPAGAGQAELTGIVAAWNLSPTQLAELDPARVDAIVTADGSAGSHLAIIARALNIPAVVGIGAAVSALLDGAIAIVDGDAGTICVEPDGSRLHQLRASLTARDPGYPVDADRAAEPALTTDGATVRVDANIGLAREAERALRYGADGVGLLRTELLFAGSATLPDEDEQLAGYERICAALSGRPVTIRSLDVGGDKPLPSLPMALEENPQLGQRGIRLSLSRPELFSVQLRAVLRAAACHPVRLMLPMVSDLAEFRAARELLLRARDRLVRQGHQVPDELALGAMIETPALALKSDAICREADFVSIGTNDLAQYTMAADRGNSAVAHLCQALDPAVLRLIDRVCRSAASHGKPVSVCGELAADHAAVTVLIGLGVRQLSVSSPAVAGVKQVVRGINAAEASELARQALRLDTATAVRDLLAGAR